MKTKNKIISIFMCICLALLSGCSQDSGGEPVTTPAATTAATPAATTDATPAATTAATPAKTSAAENADNEESGSDAVTTEDNVAETSSEETTVTEAENQPDDEPFSYYDLLSEEYDKSGKVYSLFYFDYNTTGYSTNYINGKVIIVNGENGKIKTYNYETKSDIADFQFDNFDLSYGDYEYFFYADVDDGYIYRESLYYNGGDEYIIFYKYDISGNLISKLDMERKEYLSFLCADGTFITHLGNSDDGKYYLYSEDWKTKTELPALQYDAGHGIMETIKNYNVVAKYKNKIYVYASSLYGEHAGYYCLNTDTDTCEYIESKLQDIRYKAPNSFWDYYFYKIVGRYFLNTGMVYDMETDTVIANPSYFSYNGEKSFLYLNFDGKLYRYRYSSDGSKMEQEVILEGEKNAYSSSEGQNAFAIDEECYLFVDKYGAFLRTYEGGEDGETTIMMFEN